METRISHTLSDEGIVIKRFNIGETDRLITIFSKIHGKLTLRAKGIRKASSKRSGSLELFNLIKFHAVRGRGEVDILTEVQVVDSYTSWRKHLGRVAIAYQLCEVVDKITPDRDPHPEIFDLLKDSLTKINVLGPDWKLEINNWLIEIATELGYWSKGKEFNQNIYEFIETIASRSLHSPKLLNKLK